MTGIQNNIAQPVFLSQYYPVTANNQAFQQASTIPYNQQYTPWNSGMNAVMRAQTLPIVLKGSGYTELAPFKLPILNTEGRFFKLDNGQDVVIIPKKGPTTIKTYVKTGSFNEEKNRGISHYIEHNLFNGSEGLAPNEFVEKVTGMGGLYNASTDTADTDYFIKSPLHKEGDFEEYLKMHANMLMYPSFTDKMLEKEKGPVISEIQMYQDDPYDKAYNALIKNLFQIKTDYQGLIAGSTKIIQNLKREDVVDYFNKNYRPDNMLTVIVGDVDPNKTINLASSLFNRKKSPQTKEPVYNEPLNLTPKTVREDIKSPHINAEVAALGFAGPKNNDIKDTVATMGLMSALIGHENSRLVQALKPFNSQPSADLAILSSDVNAPQLIQLAANFTSGQEEQGLKAIYSVLHRMAYEPISQQEMFIIKNKMKDNLASVSESSMGIADVVGKAVTNHGNMGYYTDWENHVDNLTPQDIQNAARKYLDLNRASIVMLHSQNTKNVSFGNNSNNSDKFKFTNVKEYNLPNNLRLVMNDDPTATKASANLEVKAGSIKTLKPGVSDILAVMLGKGTKNYTEEQLHQIIDTYNLGIVPNATGRSLNISAACPKESLPLALNVMKEILYNPDLSQEKFNKAKEEIKLQYSSVPKDPGDRAMEALYPDYLWGMTPRKILEDIDKVTLQDVQALHYQLMTDSQGVAAIDGAISATPGLGHRLFYELQSGIGFNKPCCNTPIPQSKPLEKNIIIAEAEKREQADIEQVFKIKESGNIKDHAALMLLNEVLGGNSASRLFTDLREAQKLAYRVKSSYNTDGKYGNIAFSIKTTTENDLTGACHDNLKKSLDGFKKHIDQLVTTPVTPKELEIAKLEVKTDISNAMEFSSARSNRLTSGYDTLYQAGYNNALVDVLEQITPQDIQNAAKTYLNQPSATSIIASPDTIKNMQPYLESLGGSVVYY